MWDYTAPSGGGSDSTDESTSNTETGDSGSEVSAEDLYVSDVHADAEGNDHENLNDEYISLSVFGSGSLDVGGWTIEDEAGHTYTFPSGFEITGDEAVTLYSGSDSDSDTSLYWGSDSAIWNNGGDTVIIKNDSGETVVEHSY